MATEFHLFPQLPTEVRLQIWRLCLPERVFELDKPVSFCVDFDHRQSGGPDPCFLGHTTKVNRCPPLISRICRESRGVASENGTFVSDVNDLRPEEAEWYSSTSVDPGWKDPTRDYVAHVNWWRIYEADFGWPDSPIPCVAWEASTLGGTGSLIVESFDSHFYQEWWWELRDLSTNDAEEGSDQPSPLDSDTAQELRALKKVPTWQVVMRTIVVHMPSTEVAQTQLFSLLGDAPVQIVRLVDEDRVEAFFQLAESCEGDRPWTVRQNFRRESADLLGQRLRYVLRKYQDKDLTASMHPAIMFRLCTQMCNYLEHQDPCKCETREPCTVMRP